MLFPRPQADARRHDSIQGGQDKDFPIAEETGSVTESTMDKQVTEQGSILPGGARR